MSTPAIIKRDEQLGRTLEAIMDQANITNAPVMFNVEDKGGMVMMSEAAYADFLDQIQKVDEVDFASDPMFTDLKRTR